MENARRNEHDIFNETELTNVNCTYPALPQPLHQHEINYAHFITRKATQSLGLMMIILISFYNIIECLKNIYSQDELKMNSDINLAQVKTSENSTFLNEWNNISSDITMLYN
jgi:hypothetical protein